MSNGKITYKRIGIMLATLGLASAFFIAMQCYFIEAFMVGFIACGLGYLCSDN